MVKSDKWDLWKIVDPEVFFQEESSFLLNKIIVEIIKLMEVITNAQLISSQYIVIVYKYMI